MGSAHKSMPTLAPNRNGGAVLNSRSTAHLGLLSEGGRLMEELQNSRNPSVAISEWTRRELLAVTAATGGALVGGQLMTEAISPAAAQANAAATAPLTVVLRINGAEHPLTLDPRT